MFNALYDTKCLKFGSYDLKSGLQAPYYMNLRRLPLYPKLLDAIVTQVTEKFLSAESLAAISAQSSRQASFTTNNTECLLTENFKAKALKEATSIQTTVRQISVDSCYSSASSKLPSSPGSPSDSESDDSHLNDDNDVDLDMGSQDEEWEKLGPSLDPILCGVPYGAVPLGAAIAYKSQLPFLMERAEQKEYGDQQCLMMDFNDETRKAAGGQPAEHSIEKRQRVILIEDVICSGESILETVRRLERRNLKVEFVICIVDREENGINLLLQKEGIRVLSLYKISAILRILEATGRIDHETFVQTRNWITKNQFVNIGVDPSKTTTGPAALVKSMPTALEVAAV